MSETARALRDTSDALMRELERLEVLETRKRDLVPGDPELLTLAQEIESIAVRLLGRSVRQRELSEESQDLVEADAPGAPERTIAETPRAIPTILAEWRLAERRLADAKPGSAAQRAALADREALREEYRRAQDDARRRADQGSEGGLSGNGGTNPA